MRTARFSSSGWADPHPRRQTPQMQVPQEVDPPPQAELSLPLPGGANKLEQEFAEVTMVI